MLRLGIIGLGQIHEYHARALRDTDGMSVVAVADVDPAKTPKVECERRFQTHHGLLESGLVDAVLVATPTGSHFEVARDCLRFGAHVLLEKPACVARDQLIQLYELADESKVRLVVAFHDVFGEEMHELNAGLWEDLVSHRGHPRLIEAAYCDPYAVSGADPRRRATLVGSWLDGGVNALSVLCSLIDEVTVLRAQFEYLSGSIVPGTDVEADVDLISGGEPEVEGRVTTRWTEPVKQKKTSVTFENGSIVVMDHTRQSIVDGRGEHLFWTSPETPRMTGQYKRVFQDFMQCLDAGADNRSLGWLVHDPLFVALETEASDRGRESLHG